MKSVSSFCELLMFLKVFFEMDFIGCFSGDLFVFSLTT